GNKPYGDSLLASTTAPGPFRPGTYAGSDAIASRSLAVTPPSSQTHCADSALERAVDAMASPTTDYCGDSALERAAYAMGSQVAATGLFPLDGFEERLEVALAEPHR